MDKIRFGVVGLGFRGRAMFNLACDSFDFVIPAAACDIIETNWTEKRMGVKMSMQERYPNTAFYTDYDKMLDEANLDVILVETGADIHADFCIKALEKNINVLSDIPNVLTLDEAERLWKAAEKSTAIISTGANPNYQKFAVLLKEFYDNGSLGHPYCMEGEYIHWAMPNTDDSARMYENGSNWREKLIPIRYCTHSLGPLLNILDEELRYVSCFGTGNHADDDYDAFGRLVTDKDNLATDNMECANFQTESGVIVRLMRNGRCRAKIGHHNYRVFGTEGYMERVERNEKAFIRFNSTKTEDKELQEIGGEFMPPAYAGNPKAVGHGGIDYAMFDQFFKAYFKGEPAVSLKEGLKMTLPGIFAEYSIKRKGERIRIVYPWEKDWTTKI